MRVLSREPDKSILGFSRDVARDVTHPLWPSRVPLRMSCSVMLRNRLGFAQSICDVVSGRQLSSQIYFSKFDGCGNLSEAALSNRLGKIEGSG